MAKKAAATGEAKQPTRGEIYKTNRPKDFGQIVGQPAAVKMLQGFLDRKEVPRFLLFTGPSGTGKTTLARIMKEKLGCMGSADADIDFHEINFAESRGIDTVRMIQERINRQPLRGRAVVWLIDELHAATKDAFDAMLKMLEDMPKHAYFMGATTNATKIPVTIKTRATEVALNAVNQSELAKLVDREAFQAGIEIHGAALDRIVDTADGSPRMALVLLNILKAAPNGTEEEQLELLKVGDRHAEMIEFTRALKDAPNAVPLLRMLKSLPEGTESERLRYMVLSYYNKVVMGGDLSKRPVSILRAFSKNTYDTGMAGITLAVLEMFL